MVQAMFFVNQTWHQRKHTTLCRSNVCMRPFKSWMLGFCKYEWKSLWQVIFMTSCLFENVLINNVTWLHAHLCGVCVYNKQIFWVVFMVK